MKIHFDTNGDLPLNKLLKQLMLTIVDRSVFEAEGKFYPQIYLDKSYRNATIPKSQCFRRI